MKKQIDGKDINQYAINKANLPDGYGHIFREYPFGKICKVDGPYIAKRYNAILKMISENKASVQVTDQEIQITYPNGSAKIRRDVLTNTFLIPVLCL